MCIVVKDTCAIREELVRRKSIFETDLALERRNRLPDVLHTDTGTPKRSDDLPLSQCEEWNAWVSARRAFGPAQNRTRLHRSPVPECPPVAERPRRERRRGDSKESSRFSDRVERGGQQSFRVLARHDAILCPGIGHIQMAAAPGRSQGNEQNGDNGRSILKCRLSELPELRGRVPTRPFTECVRQEHRRRTGTGNPKWASAQRSQRVEDRVARVRWLGDAIADASRMFRGGRPDRDPGAAITVITTFSMPVLITASLGRSSCSDQHRGHTRSSVTP